MAFDNPPLPKEILNWIEAAYGNSGNKTGLQGTHIVAKPLWAQLEIQRLLGLGDLSGSSS